MNPADKQSELEAIAARILANANQGTLASLSDKHPDYPFASVAPYALLPDGMPVFLFSSMSVHSRNLKRNPRATLLVVESETASVAGGRVSVIGKVEPLNASLTEAAKEVYLLAHPDAQQWVSFGDFAFYGLAAIDTYIVAGFGSMGWVKPDGSR